MSRQETLTFRFLLPCRTHFAKSRYLVSTALKTAGLSAYSLLALLSPPALLRLACWLTQLQPITLQGTMRWLGFTLLQWWHRFLGLQRQSSLTWHQDRLREELQERREAPSLVLKLSETADVFFSISRAKYDGFYLRELPPFLAIRNIPVWAYMIGKFTLRWTFYRTAAFICKTPHHTPVREVVNPKKDDNLHQVASRHGIDPEQFKRVSRRLRTVWPLLP